MPIYCDEAGYTGYNLLEENQPYFVYAALNLEEGEANEFRDYLKDKYRLQGELKGKNLVKSKQGQGAIRELYEKYADKVRVVYHHKKYALACKYFEYVFEPVVSDYNSFFYRQNFHRFISHLVYLSFEANEKRAEDIFWAFQELLRGNDKEGLFRLLKEKSLPNELISLIAEFTILQKAAIMDEITTGGVADYWILDLAQTAIHNLLCLWSVEVGGLSVICDPSKPLKETIDRNPLFTRLNDEVRYLNPFGQGEIPINFSLKVAIQFKASNKCYGLQLADLFSSSVYWSLNNPEDPLSVFVRSYETVILNKSGFFCIGPEPEKFMRTDTNEFQFGVMALRRLTEYSYKKPETAGARFMKLLEGKIKKLSKLR